MFLVQIDVGAQGRSLVLHPRGDEGAQVILIGVFKFHDDAAFAADQVAGSKADFAPVVIYDVVQVLPALHALTVEPHFFGTRKHDDEPFVVGAPQFIRPLIAFTGSDDVAGKFTARYGYAGAVLQHAFGPEFGFLPISRPLQFFVIIHEITVRAIQLVVARRQLGVFFAQLHKNPIQFLELHGVAFGLQGDTFVRNGREDLNSIAQVSGQLQVETGVEHQILAIAEGNAP